MKIFRIIYRRVLVHWQSSLFGLSYIIVFFFLWTKHINVAEALSLLTGILAFKGIFMNKDPDKVPTKDEFKDPGNQ